MTAHDIRAPQWGEYVWHAFASDPRIPGESDAHGARIEAAVRRHLPALDWSRARLLEIGSYRHYTGHALAAKHGCEYVASDLSAAALRDGRRQAEGHGVEPRATLVAADFHDLPFSSDCFDVVFVAASVHHTRRPELVLREMLRVVRPGGILFVDNEPCARVCCFHAFSCNRAESLTPFEARLRDAGLLPTLSSPFWGSRPEQLFGMVENDRIPLSLFHEAFTDAGSVVEENLSFDGLVGPLETALLALTERGSALRAKVRELLRNAVAIAQDAYGETERLLGYALPTEADIHALAAAIARLLVQREHYATESLWRAELFGAALRAVVRKHGHASADVPLFRRDMITDADGLAREAVALPDPLLPDLPTCEDGAALAPWFAPEHWRWFVNEDGVRSMANLGALCPVDLAPQDVPTLLLVRYHAVVTDGQRYRVRLWGGGVTLADDLVVLQETRLFRVTLPPACSEFLFEIAGEDGGPAADPAWRIRVSVVQQFLLT